MLPAHLCLLILCFLRREIFCNGKLRRWSTSLLQKIFNIFMNIWWQHACKFSAFVYTVKNSNRLFCLFIGQLHVLTTQDVQALRVIFTNSFLSSLHTDIKRFLSLFFLNSGEEYLLFFRAHDVELNHEPPLLTSSLYRQNDTNLLPQKIFVWAQFEIKKFLTRALYLCACLLPSSGPYLTMVEKMMVSLISYAHSVHDLSVAALTRVLED